jgi:hypothetical protein
MRYQQLLDLLERLEVVEQDEELFTVRALYEA